MTILHSIRDGMRQSVFPLAVLAALAAPGLARAADPAAEGRAAIVAAVEPLAAHKSGFAKSFAKVLADVLMRNKVPLPESLASITVPTGRQAALTDEDLRAIYEMTDKLARLCKAGGPYFGILPPTLQVDLLDEIVNSCPSSLARVETALYMAEQARREADARRTLPIPPLLAAFALRTALYYCFDHTHCAWLTADDVRALQAAHNFQLLQNFIYLKALAEPTLTPGELEKTLQEIAERLSHAAEGGETPMEAPAQQAIAALVDESKELMTKGTAILEFVQARRDIQTLIGAFLAAVNKEDKDAAAKCLTAATAAALKQLPSLRAGIGGAENVRKIEFKSMAMPTISDKKYRIEVNLELTDDKGQTSSAIANFQFVKTDAGWRIGQP